MSEYPLEDVRTFFMRRSWLASPYMKPVLISPEEYQALKARTLELPRNRVHYLRAFIDGWLAANP